MGDQKYLNNWTRDFEGGYELQNLGGGVAPWNLEQYILLKHKENDIKMMTKMGKDFTLIFYHFQNIRYLPRRRVNIKSQTKNKKLKYAIYIPYLKEIENKGIVRSSNPIVGAMQKYFAAFKLQSVSDVINLDRLDNYIKE